MTYIPTISPIIDNLDSPTSEGEYARRIVTAACYLNSLRSIEHVIGCQTDPKQMRAALTNAITRAIDISFEIGKTPEEVREDTNRQAFLLLNKMTALYIEYIEA